MTLQVGCLKCAAPVSEAPGAEGQWICVEHGPIDPLWRPEERDYETFGEHLRAGGEFPTYLPWPLSPGWSVTDFALVCPSVDGESRARASLTCCSGTSALDGPVDVLVISEEPGTGLGARVAGMTGTDPGPEVGAGQPAVRVRIDSQVVPMWPVSVSETSGEWDRSVMVGEAFGRWLWLVMRPASAMLLLRDDWILRDASQAGPHLVELPFGGPAPSW